MARYEKAGEAQRPQWEPDVARIIDGTPFTTEGLSESEAAAVLTQCPAPILTATGAWHEKPEGWELRTDQHGRMWFMHPEFTRRAKMARFQRRPHDDSEAPRRVFEGARK